MDDLQLINTNLLEGYLTHVSGIEQKFETLKDAAISTETFSFYTSVATVFSSKIEGENIELDSYIKHKGQHVAFKADYTKKIDDLYNAYLFAQQHALTPQHITKAHKLLAKNLVASAWQGKLRTQNMYVATDEGQIEYVAASAPTVTTEMKKFYQDIERLLKQSLTYEEVFYYAAYIHLVFVKIHPWNDGNGRSARLLEKWFIAEKLGKKAWFLQSEKNYYNHHATYYQNLRRLGIEYDHLDYSKALPFLLMLPQCLAL